jgi:phosphatidylglycerophosphate synthase
MKELDPLVFLAVFQEMLGPMLWVMLLAAVVAVVAFVALVMREKGIVSRRLVRAELLGLLGGVVALVIMAQVSSSGFTDAGGPADWFLIALVYGVGLVATVILTYAAMGWMGSRKTGT